MKKWIISIIVFLVVSGNLLSQEVNDIKKEEAAIISVIEAATQAWVDRDIEALAATHITDETFKRLVASKNGFEYSLGWEERAESAKKTFAASPNPNAVKFENKSFQIKIYPKSAWAVYEEHWFDPEGEYLGKSINARFLEKIKTDWKIVYLSVINAATY